MIYRRGSKAREIAVNLLHNLNTVLLIDRCNDYEIIDRNYIMGLTSAIYGWACGISNTSCSSIVKLIEVYFKITDSQIQEVYLNALVKFINEWKLTANSVSSDILNFLAKFPLPNETAKGPT